jgi:5-formyltetrahydrofolate cyclo-ligase
VNQAVRAHKAELRVTLLAARSGRDDEQRAAAGSALAGWADALHARGTVAAYVGVGTEPPTLPLLDLLYGAGQRILLPLVRPGRVLDWAAGPPAQAAMVPGPLGLLEPAADPLGPEAVREAGLVLVPALAVDRSGHRLGRGGGYYDLALAQLPATARVIAVVFDDELLDEVPVEAHDRTVDGALTPSGLTMFARFAT